MPELPEACLNCSTPLPDPAFVFCPRCGQENQPRVLPFSHVMREAVAEFVQIDGKLARTFGALLFRPGFLTGEFLAGRRIRFLSPLKMYLFTSATFFLLVSLVFPFNGSDIENYIQQASRDEVQRKSSNPRVVGARVAVTGAKKGPSPLPDKSDWVRVPPFRLMGQTIDMRKLPSSVFAYREAQATLERTGKPTDPLVVQAVKRKLIRLRESPGDAIRAICVGTLSNMTLIAVPLLALFMLPLYLRPNRRLYIEHFVFQLHCHTFFFVVLTLSVILASAAPAGGFEWNNLLLLWLPFYGVLALRRVYGQSVWKSLLKALLMLIGYGGILFLTAALGVLLTLVSILISL